MEILKLLTIRWRTFTEIMVLKKNFKKILENFEVLKKNFMKK